MTLVVTLAYEWAWQRAYIDSAIFYHVIVPILAVIWGSYQALGAENTIRNNNREDEEDEDKATANTRMVPARRYSRFSEAISTYHEVLTFSYTTSIICYNIFIRYFAEYAGDPPIFIHAGVIALTNVLQPLCRHAMRYLREVNHKRVAEPEYGTLVAGFVLSRIFFGYYMKTNHWLSSNVVAVIFIVFCITAFTVRNLRRLTFTIVVALILASSWISFSRYYQPTSSENQNNYPELHPFFAVLRNLFWSNNLLQYPAIRFAWPETIVAPSPQNPDDFMHLGVLGILLPGIVICFALRFDASRRFELPNQITEGDVPVPSFSRRFRLSYFNCTLIFYTIGLLINSVPLLDNFEGGNQILPAYDFKLYQHDPKIHLGEMIPCFLTVISLVVMAYRRGNLKEMWSGSVSVERLRRLNGRRHRGGYHDDAGERQESISKHAFWRVGSRRIGILKNQNGHRGAKWSGARSADDHRLSQGLNSGCD